MIRANVRRQQQQQHEEEVDEEAPRLSPLLRRPVLLPLFLSMSLMFFQQWCGVNAVIFYTVYIFSSASAASGEPPLIDENAATIVVGVVQFLATFGGRSKK